ncbi:MAG TPA: hypothetical protein VE913_15470 [Longimicrobium sp.]|nr:hypothetical protein [Longimicrobium sp.]
MPVPTAPDVREIDLTGDAGDALLAVAVALEAAFLVWETDPTSELGHRLRAGGLALAAGLVARARRAPDAPTDADLRMEAARWMEDAAGAVGAREDLLPTTLDEVDNELLEFTSELINEAALESHDHEAGLGFREEDETIVLACSPLSPGEARIGLLALVFRFVEAAVARDPLLAMEREASAWWFERWTVDTEEHVVPATVREGEFSLVERATLRDNRPVLQALLKYGELDDLPPRQRKLAEQLWRSVVGVWTVRERDDDGAVLVWEVDDTVFRVREDPGADYVAGDVAVGRLIPLGDGEWMRSPGMVLLDQPGDEWVDAVSRAFADAIPARIPDGVVVEAALTRSAGGDVPRRIPPARGAAEARTVLADALRILGERGFARPLDDEERSVGMVAHRHPTAHPPVDFVADTVVSEWLTALAEMGRKGTGGSKSKSKKRRR